MTSAYPSGLEAERTIRAKLVECGLPSEGFSVRYEDYLQSIEVFIPASTKVNAEQFECIHSAVGSEIVTIEDAATASAFSDYQNERLRPELLARVTKEAEVAGLLANFPSRDDLDSIQVFAEAIERHVGLAPGSALRAEDNKIIVLPPAWGGLEIEDKRFGRLLTAVMYASLSDGRTQFGFIGNAAVAPDDEDK